MNSDGKVTCDICRKFGFSGGVVGHSELCIDCYNKFDQDQTRARAAERNEVLQNQNVAMDQAMEQDGRVVHLRAEVKRLQDRIWMLERRVTNLGGSLDFTSSAPTADPEPQPPRSEE